MQERVILKVGSEGGTLTLVENGKTPPRFSARLADQSMLLLDEGPAVKKRSEWMTWSKALEALGTYPWTRLYPLETAPEYCKRIWALVRAEAENIEPSHLERWAEVCGIAPEIAHRAARKTRPSAKKAARSKSPPPHPVELVRIEGDTSVFIEAKIDPKGALEISGQEFGAAPSAVFGSSEYEYFLTVHAKDKDALLLALLEALYKNDPRAVSRLEELAASKKIKTECFSP